MLKHTIGTITIAGIALVSLAGCSDTATVKHESTTTTPGGSTTTTIEKTVETTGSNPPPAAP